MLSNFIKTRQFPTKDHDIYRTEFRPDHAAYLSNVRIIDIAATVTSAQTHYLPCNAGTDALIHDILLYSGNRLIGNCRNADRFAALENSKGNNGAQFSVLPQLKHTRMGTINRHEVGVNANAGYGFVRQHLRNANAVHNTVADVALHRGTVLLSDYIPFFKSTPTLNFIPNLRIVIEWNDLSTSGFLDSPDGGTITAYEFRRPLLVMDEIIDPRALANMKPEMNVTYFNNSYDKTDIEAVASGTQKTELPLNGFDGQYLRRLVVAIRTASDSASQTSGLAGYVARMPYELKYEPYVNGTPLFQYQGLDGPTRFMAEAHRAGYGQAASLFHYLYRNYYADLTFDWDRLVNQVGRRAYVVHNVDDVVNELRMDLSRTYIASPSELDTAATIDCWGEVRRQFTLLGGDVQIEAV